MGYYLERHEHDPIHNERLTEDGTALAGAMLSQVRLARLAASEVVNGTLDTPQWASPVKDLLARAELVLDGMLIDGRPCPCDEGFYQIIGALREALFAYWGSKAIAKEVAHA